MRNPRINTCGRMSEMCKGYGQYYSDTCNPELKNETQQSKAIMAKGLYWLSASQKLHSALISFIFSRKPSAVLGPGCCLMVLIKSKRIFKWNVGCSTYNLIRQLKLELIRKQINLMKSYLSLYLWPPILLRKKRE